MKLRMVVAVVVVSAGFLAHAQDEDAVFNFPGGDRLRQLVSSVKALEKDWPQSGASGMVANLISASDAWAAMPAEVREKPLAVKYQGQLAKWEKRVKAARCKERAVIAMVRARDASAGDDYSADAAKEYYKLALEWWDAAFALTPDLKTETLKIDDLKGESKSVADWRALAAKKLAEL